MAEDFVFADTGDETYGPNFGALVGQSNLGDFVETGMNVNLDASNNEITVTTGQAYVARDGVQFTDNDGNTVQRLRTVNVAQLEERTNKSVTDSTVNYVYLDSDAGGSNSPSINVKTTDSGGYAELKIAEVNTTSDAVTEVNRNPDVSVGELNIKDGDVIDGDGNVVYNQSQNYVEQGRLQNDSITINANSGLAGGGSPSLGGSTGIELQDDDITINTNNGLSGGSSVSLGDSISISADTTDIAGNALDGSNNDLDVASDGIGTSEIDLGISPTWTSQHRFDSGLDTRGDIVDDSDTIWDSASGSIATSVLGFDGTLENDSGDLSVDESYAFSWSGEHSFGGGLSDGNGNSVVGSEGVVATGTATGSTPHSVSTGLSSGNPTFFVSFAPDELSSTTASAQLEYNIERNENDNLWYVVFEEDGTNEDPDVHYDIIRTR